MFGGDPPQQLTGRVIAQDLFDRVGPSLGVRTQRGQLIRVTDERHDGLAEDMSRGDEPRAEDQPREHPDLQVGEIAVAYHVRQDAVGGVVVA